MSMNNTVLNAVKFVAVIDGFLLALQLLPYGGYDGAPADVPNIHGWQAIMVVLFIISVGYLYYTKTEEIDDLKSQLSYQKSKNPDNKKD